MAATLTTAINVRVNATLQNTVGVAAADGIIDQIKAFAWASGVGADSADKAYSVTITRTHGSPAGDIDLAGSVTDVFGTTITMARIKAIMIFAYAANINSVVVGGGATAPITTCFFDYVATALAQPAMKIRPGGLLLLAAPQAVAYVVTATTADKLQIANGDEDGSTSVSADVVIIGAST